MIETERTELETRLRSVRAPQAILTRERAGSLTPRQREILDELGAIFNKGFADVTMADLAAQLNCSLRTLYGMAESRDELVLMVIDRNLRATGRQAMAAIEPDMAPLDALRSYLAAANVAVSSTTAAFAHDLLAVPAGPSLNSGHNNYIVSITQALLDLAVERGDIEAIDTTAVAQAVAGLGRLFARPDVIPSLATSPKDAADSVVDIILRGLTTPA